MAHFYPAPGTGAALDSISSPLETAHQAKFREALAGQKAMHYWLYTVRIISQEREKLT